MKQKKVKRIGNFCMKQPFYTEREAKKGLKKAKHIGVNMWYQCALHGDTKVYHLTSNRTKTVPTLKKEKNLRRKLRRNAQKRLGVARANSSTIAHV